MIGYPKIKTAWKRDPETKYKTLVEGDWALPEFEYLADNAWIGTEKIHGTNIRVGWDGEDVEFGGRTNRAQIQANLVNALRDIFPADAFPEVFDSGGFVLFGEGYGPKIQKGGGRYRDDASFILFDVYCEPPDLWLAREDVEDVAEKLGIDVVPIVTNGTLNAAIDFVAEGFPSWVAGKHGDETYEAEGLVLRPKVELRARTGKRVITKIKNADFVL